MEGAAAAAGRGGGDEHLPSSLVFRWCHLPPGFRFQPTDQEIIVCYLKKKIAGTATSVTSIIADVDIYKFDPWDLPDKAMFGEGEWFFFSPRDRKYPNGARPNRTAGSGYWKATGTDKPILAPGGAHCLGVKKALVFYQGRSPKGTKTEWVMHEYRLLDAAAVLARPTAHSMRLDDWVLCRVRKKGVSLGPVDIEGTTKTAVPANAPVTGYHHADMEMEIPGYHQVPDAGTGGGFGDVVIDWNKDDDGHLLQYLIASSGGLGGSPSPHHMQMQDDQRSSSAAIGHHHHGLVSVLESIKRNLSFQAIDELY